jgi:hypothetical protein
MAQATKHDLGGQAGIAGVETFGLGEQVGSIGARLDAP